MKRTSNHDTHDLMLDTVNISSPEELANVLQEFSALYGFKLLCLLGVDKKLKTFYKKLIVPPTGFVFDQTSYDFVSSCTNEFNSEAYYDSFFPLSFNVLERLGLQSIRSLYILPLNDPNGKQLIFIAANEKKRGIKHLGINCLRVINSCLVLKLAQLEYRENFLGYLEAAKQFSDSANKIVIPGQIESNFKSILESLEKTVYNECKCSLLWLYNETQGNDELVLRYATKIPTHEWKQTHISIHDSTTGLAIIKGDILDFADVQKDKLFRNPEVAQKYGLKQLIVIPLFSGDNRKLGALNIYPQEDFKLTNQLRDILKLYASSVGRIFESVEMKDRLKTLDNVISMYGTTGFFSTEQQFFETLVTKLKSREFLGVQGASIFLRVPGEEVLYLCATTGLDKPYKIGDRIYHFGEGLTGTVAKKKNTIIVHDLHIEKGGKKGTAIETTDEPGKTWIGTPIREIVTGEVLGVIRCVNKVRGEHMPFMEFTALDQKVLEFLAFLSALIIQYLRMIKEKETTLKSQYEFITSLSHEIDSPITSILGRTDLIKDYYEDLSIPKEKKALWVKDISDECEHIDFLARRYRLQEPVFKKINFVREVIISIVNLLRPSASSKHISIYYDINMKIPDLYIDPHRFRQVIYNVLNNAIKYSHRNTNITISVEHKIGSSVMIEISNEGIGVPEGWEKRIFDENQKAPGAKAYNPSGTGKGLYYCVEIVEKEHGGKIWLKQNAKPTIFSILIPPDRVD